MSAPGADPLVTQLIALLKGGQAHVGLDDAVKGFPAKLQGTVPGGLPYSAWQVLEHLRIAQRDILEFCSPNPEGYKPLAWPDAYWPKVAVPPSAESWGTTLTAIKADAESFIALLQHNDADLYTPFPWGEGQNLLREALLIADHNSYHLGEFVLLRRVLGTWDS